MSGRDALEEFYIKLKYLGMSDFEIDQAIDYAIDHMPVYDPKNPNQQALHFPKWFWRRVDELAAKKVL